MDCANPIHGGLDEEEGEEEGEEDDWMPSSIQSHWGGSSWRILVIDERINRRLRGGKVDGYE